MRVDDNIKKCVVFVGYQLADETFRFAGSAFLLGRDDSPESPTYLVTARHVIDGIRSNGLTKIWLRANHTKGHSEWYPTDQSNWFSHPHDKSIDVSIIKLDIRNDLDHLIFPFSECSTPDLIVQNGVGVGDEVFIVGLFRHHHGNGRNIPIIRVGNLASMDEERVVTKDFGPMDARLIEARSIGGLSGSPVFLNFGATRFVDGIVKFDPGRKHHLYGLIHGHFDVLSSQVDQSTNPDCGQTVDQVNTGIAIVVPFKSIEAVIGEFEQIHGT